MTVAECFATAFLGNWNMVDPLLEAAVSVMLDFAVAGH